MKTIDEYLALITNEHNDKSKYMATVRSSIEPIVQLQNFLLELPQAFDLDEAVGYQLDVIGLWVGITRKVKTLITDVYFTWEDQQLGWGQGTWKGDYDPDKGLYELPDDIYRQLIKTKIAANYWDGSIAGAYKIWQQIFKDQALIIHDNQDMSMVLGIAGMPLNPIWEALLTEGYIPLKPQGVRINYIAVANNAPLFAWDAESENTLMGWELGAWPKEMILNQKGIVK